MLEINIQKFNEILFVRYLCMKKKRDELVALYGYNEQDHDSEDDEPSAKKQKITNMHDPFEALIPELGDEILKYLIAQELY